MMRRSLFIFNFDKKKWKALFLTLAAIAFFGAGTKLLNYLYWQEDDWGRIFWHNYYKQTDNIDYIYLGSSHVFYNLNPEILDEKNGKNNFNMATSVQRLIESYYLLKEANGRHEIKKAYLELYYNISTGIQGDYHAKYSVLNSAWRAIDYMRFSPGKIRALFCINPIEYYPEAFFPFIRYRGYLMDGDWIKKRVNDKNEENYKKYIYNDGITEYKDKGYYYTTSELANPFFGRDRKAEEMFLTEDAETYLRKIITYCQSEGIELTLFTSPVYELELLSTENYDCYADDIKEISTEYSVPYYDFNMAKEEYFPIQYPEYFVDVGHLNAKGVELYTNFFHQVVSASVEENAKYFHDSYQEKLESTEPKVYGLYYYEPDVMELQEGEDPDNTQRMAVACNREDELEYQIFITPDEGETFLLQDFSTNKKFNMSKWKQGVCKIVWRNIKDKEKIESMEIQY